MIVAVVHSQAILHIGQTYAFSFSIGCGGMQAKTIICNGEAQSGAI